MCLRFTPAFAPFIFSLLLLVTTSCNNPEKYIAREWRVEKFMPGIDFSGSPEHVKLFSEFEKYARLEFKKDGTYHFNLITDIQKGTWKLDRKKMIVTTTDENGKATESIVLEVNEKKMVIEQVSDEGYRHKLALVPVEPSN